MFADGEVTSQNVVGYQNKAMTFDDESLATGYKYMTLTFRQIAGGTGNVQDLQLSTDASDYDVNLQKLDFEGGGACYFYWLTKDSAIIMADGGEMVLPDGWNWEGKNGCWATDDEDSGLVVIPSGEFAELQVGETVQLDGFANTEITMSGAVTDAQIVYPMDFSEEGTATGYRYIGNAFPQDISVQDVQLNVEASDYDANLQFLDFEGGGACYLYWLTKDSAIIMAEGGEMELPDGWNWEGKNGCWATDDEDSGLVVIPSGKYATVLAGEGFQVDGFDGLTVYVNAPFDL